MVFVLHGDPSELASCRRVIRYGGTRSEWHCRGKLQIYPNLCRLLHQRHLLDRHCFLEQYCLLDQHRPLSQRRLVIQPLTERFRAANPPAALLSALPSILPAIPLANCLANSPAIPFLVLPTVRHTFPFPIHTSIAPDIQLENPADRKLATRREEKGRSRCLLQATPVVRC